MFTRGELCKAVESAKLSTNANSSLLDIGIKHNEQGLEKLGPEHKAMYDMCAPCEGAASLQKEQMRAYRCAGRLDVPIRDKLSASLDESRCAGEMGMLHVH